MVHRAWHRFEAGGVKSPPDSRRVLSAFPQSRDLSARFRVLLAVCLAVIPLPLVAQEIEKQVLPRPENGTTDEIVTYPAEFFERYEPGTALDMVQRVPGFQLDDGDDTRGLGGAAGNILINDHYPSAKQDKPSNLLDRIPASQVDRIELVRGQTRGINLRGHSAVANVIIRGDTSASGATRYEVGIRKILGLDPISINAGVSVSDNWEAVAYNAGVYGRRFASGDIGTKSRYQADGRLTESYLEKSLRRGSEGSANLNASASFGSTLARVNADIGFEDRGVTLTAERDTGNMKGGPVEDFFVDESDLLQLELGADVEAELRSGFVTRAIALYNWEQLDAVSSQLGPNVDGLHSLFRRSDSDLTATEAVARLEIDWLGWTDHALRFNIEAANNVIDSTLIQVIDSGAGLEEVPVPGGNTRVEENRGEVFFGDTWYLNDFVLSYGMGMEASRISQTGDSVLTRKFFFLKPEMELTYSHLQWWQTKLRVAREVSQLDFNDFISATVFQDDDLALGNPDLRPESSWAVELSAERRFKSLSVIRGTVFHDWISDVQDLLPLTRVFEAPGNIGDGRRWGVVLEATIPLDAIGIAAARLDVEAHLQDSNVIDPVTGRERVFSGEPADGRPLVFGDDQRYAFAVEFRQDFSSAEIAWGWDVRKRAERTGFKVNELAVHSEDAEVNAFIETTRWFGHKVSLSVENLLNMHTLRSRTLYSGLRTLSPVDFIELRDLQDRRRVLLSIAGSF